MTLKALLTANHVGRKNVTMAFWVFMCHWAACWHFLGYWLVCEVYTAIPSVWFPLTVNRHTARWHGVWIASYMWLHISTGFSDTHCTQGVPCHSWNRHQAPPDPEPDQQLGKTLDGVSNTLRWKWAHCLLINHRVYTSSFLRISNATLKVHNTHTHLSNCLLSVDL